MSASPLRQGLSLAARIVVTVLLLWYVFGKVDFTALAARARDFSFVMLLLTVPLLLMQIVLAALRWGTVIRAIYAPAGFNTVLPLMYVGIFFNQVLPSAIGGDAVRVWHIYRQGLSLRAAFNSVLLDRLVAMAALLAVMLSTLFWFYRLVDDGRVRLAVNAAIGLLAAGLVLLYLFKSLPEAFDRWRPTRALCNLSRDLYALVVSPGAMRRALSLSVLLHVLTAFVVYVIARSLSLPLGVLDCLALVPPVILLTVLPISLAGWGVRELGMIAALGYAGIAATDALLISITYGVLALLVSLPGGWFWLAKKYHQPRASLSFSEAVGKSGGA